ncbi:aminotransferase class V-fold PLP-dependent enzyme [Thaumasiovibrio subtropicus]|uniref:aminotransferase class V-fold PLP-dependent enzyme n=1 Tax=Thaumasiovibrio subtropicus TaxID=1891207 RepID=UPI000B352977|nr:SufS family cysteine desulfurase [Thaumasiovibrio subtropicus]
MTVDTPTSSPCFDHALAQQWRAQFPTLSQIVNDKPLIYLDTAATAQTPQPVIDRMTHFYQHEYASVHRGVHRLSADATQNVEQVRDDVQHFLNAEQREEIVFTKGTTEAINLVAHGYVKPHCQSGDEIIITEMEHHANIVPWQIVAKECNLTVKVWPITPQGELDINDLMPLLSDRTRLIAVSHVSNLLGTVNDIAAISRIASERGIKLLVDGAQAVMHQHVDVSKLNCDFYVFSAHKLYGPTGIGILYGRKSLLDEMSPWEAGGAMIDTVSIPSGTTYNRAPWRFEAGTPNIAGILGLGAALQYVNELDLALVEKQETVLLEYALNALETVPGVEVYGSPQQRAGVIPFNLTPHHAYDVGMFLDNYGIAIRTGHHCAMPLLKKLDQSAICRASIGCYTTKEDIDAFVHALHRIRTLLG